MQELTYIGAAVVAFWIIYTMVFRSKADKVLAELQRKDRTDETKEIARLEQEILDAKVNLAHARSKYDKSQPKGGQ